MNQSVTSKYDSEFCGSLPIHLINVIQPYGALLVLDKDHRVVQASENIETLFRIPVSSIINSSLKDFIPETNISILEEKFHRHVGDNIPMVWDFGGRRYLVIAHFKDPFYLVEIDLDSPEEVENGSFVDVYQELKYAMTAIESARTVREAVDIAARELKKSSGFDKVMIYRFDEDWNGHVLAEEREPDMESYLDFTFPASDIPRQARELYLKNAYRLIPNREYQPVKLYPVINPATQTFIDLSDCNLRGVSTVHLEYLRNMHVMASMSTRILKDGKLWGLIACHHKTAMRNSYKMCSIFELLSNVISSKISSVENLETHVLNNHLLDHYTELVEESYRQHDLVKGLLGEDYNLLKTLDATGAVIAYNGKMETAGVVPDKHLLEDLILWLHTKQIRTIYATERLPALYDRVQGYESIASGLLVIPLNGRTDEYVLLFRPEVIQVINWGGNPENRIQFESDMKTYHPRFSFKLWQEQVRGISEKWKPEEIQLAENLRNFLFQFLNAN